MNTHCLFSAFNLTKINRMQVCLFSKLLLIHPGQLAVFSYGFTNDFLMWKLLRHVYYASKKLIDNTHCITFYLFLAFFMLKL